MALTEVDSHVREVTTVLKAHWRHQRVLVEPFETQVEAVPSKRVLYVPVECIVMTQRSSHLPVSVRKDSIANWDRRVSMEAMGNVLQARIAPKDPLGRSNVRKERMQKPPEVTQCVHCVPKDTIAMGIRHCRRTVL